MLLSRQSTKEESAAAKSPPRLQRLHPESAWRRRPSATSRTPTRRASARPRASPWHASTPSLKNSRPKTTRSTIIAAVIKRGGRSCPNHVIEPHAKLGMWPSRRRETAGSNQEGGATPLASADLLEVRHVRRLPSFPIDLDRADRSNISPIIRVDEDRQNIHVVELGHLQFTHPIGEQIFGRQR